MLLQLSPFLTHRERPQSNTQRWALLSPQRQLQAVTPGYLYVSHLPTNSSRNICNNTETSWVDTKLRPHVLMAHIQQHYQPMNAPLPLNRLRFAIKFHPNQLGWQTCTSRVGFAVCSTKTPCHVRCSTAITRLLPTPTTAGHSAASQTSGLQILVPTLPRCTAAPRSATDPTMVPTAARPILKPRTKTAGLCSGATKSHSVNRKAVRAHSEARRAFSLPPPQDARLTCWRCRSGAVREGPSQHRGVVGCLRGAARAPGGAAFLSARRQRSHAQGKRPHAAVSPQPGGPHGGAARLRPALPL